MKLIECHVLQQAGWVIHPNELTLEEWFDLGRVKEALTPPHSCPLMGGGNGK
jgi:hypothetical protein